jgi:carbamoylphosphate synthase large subunit
MDTNPSHLVAASVDADLHVQCRPAGDPGFSEDLGSAVRSFDVGMVVPMLPMEMVAAARLRAEGGFGEAVRVLAPGVDACRQCADKHELAHVLASAGIPVPPTWRAGQQAEADRYFLKPASGFGSRGCRVVEAARLHEALIGEDRSHWVVQGLCMGPEFSVDVFRSRSGLERALCRERLEVKSGVATKCRIFEDAFLAGIALGACRALSLWGTSCVQLMQREGRAVVTDVNPRPGGGTSMAQATGNDFIAAHLLEGWGRDASGNFRAVESPSWAVRHWQDRLMPTSPSASNRPGDRSY